MDLSLNVLALGAHPDDIELGCGGTLIKHSRRGDGVYLAILTDGSMGGEPRVRTMIEQEESSAILQVKRIFWGEFKDTELPVSRESISLIESVMDRITPDIVYMPSPSDTHQDHRNLAYAGISATRFHNRVLMYEGPTSMSFEPDVFIDISEVIDEKIAAIKAHKSQDAKSLKILEIMKSLARYRGLQGLVEYAEGFKALRFLMRL